MANETNLAKAAVESVIAGNFLQAEKTINAMLFQKAGEAISAKRDAMAETMLNAQTETVSK